MFLTETFGFPRLSNSLFFFSSLSPSTSSTDSTYKATHTRKPMIHQSTYSNPSPHTQSHTHTQTQIIKPLTEPHTQTIKPVGANNGHHTHHLSHRSANPSHQSETHTADLKPRPSKIPRKCHHHNEKRCHRSTNAITATPSSDLASANSESKSERG